MYAAVYLTVFINRQSGSRSLPPTLLITTAKLMVMANRLRCQPEEAQSILPWGWVISQCSLLSPKQYIYTPFMRKN